MTNKSTRLNSRGASFIEFALILPALILILAGGFEFTMLLKAKQHLSHLTSLTGESAFRSCANLLGGAQSVSYKECLSRWLINNSGLRQTILPGTDIVLSLYGSIASPPSVIDPDPDDEPTGIQLTAGMLGQYPATPQSAYNAWWVSYNIRSLSPANNRVLIAELTYRYQPYFSIFKLMFGNSYVLKETGIY